MSDSEAISNVVDVNFLPAKAMLHNFLHLTSTSRRSPLGYSRWSTGRVGDDGGGEGRRRVWKRDHVVSDQTNTWLPTTSIRRDDVLHIFKQAPVNAVEALQQFDAKVSRKEVMIR